MKQLNLAKYKINNFIKNDYNNEGLHLLGLVYENLICIVKYCPAFQVQAKEDLQSVKKAIYEVLDELCNEA